MSSSTLQVKTKPTPLARPRLSSKARSRIAALICYILLVLGGIVCVFPFLWMLSTSLKTAPQVFLYPIKWIPEPIVWRNYIDAWQAANFSRFYFNSAYISALSIIGAVISCSLAAYGFARLSFPGRDILFVLVLATMMLPNHVTIIPLFIIYRTLGWLDTHLPLYVPYFFAPPFFVFLMRQYFLSLPPDLEDAARIDGCNRLQILTYIFLPLAKPAITAVAIFVFIDTWNEFFMPLIVITSRTLYTVQLGLMTFRGEFSTEWNLLMAASVTALLPCLIVFFLFQRYFIRGLSLSGLKG